MHLTFDISARITFRTLIDLTLLMEIDVDDALSNPDATIGAAVLDAEMSTLILQNMVPEHMDQWGKCDEEQTVEVASLLVLAYHRQLCREIMFANKRYERLVGKAGAPEEGDKAIGWEFSLASGGYLEYNRLIDTPIADVLSYVAHQAVNTDWQGRQADG